MAKFHDYTYSNVLLILAQKPDAPELKESLDVICRTADWLIDRLEEAMAIREDEGIGMLTM